MPYWRRDDVTREADLVEEVGRIWGFERLPLTLPSRRGVSGRLEPRQRLRRRAEDALVGAGLYEMLGWSFAAPSLVDRLQIPADDPRHRVVRLANPMSEEQSVLRTTLLGSLLDNLQRNRSRGHEDVRLWERGAVYLGRDGGEAGNGRIPGLDRLPDEREHLAALLTGHLRPPTWRDAEPPRADFFAAKGVLGAVMDAIRVPWEVEPVREPFLHPGPRRARAGGGRARGLARRDPPRRRGGLGPRAGRGLRARLRRARPRGRRHARLRRRDHRSRASGRTWRSSCPTAPRRPRSSAWCGRPAASLLSRAEVFDVYRGAQVGEGSASLALRLEFRASDRTLTDEEADKRRAKIVAALADSSGRSCVPDVAVLGASGYAGAIAATLLHRHPYFTLSHVTARSESGAMLDAIHPRTRVPLLLEDYDPAVQGDVDAALVCWPHGVAAPAVAALRERGVRVVDLSADFRLRDRAVYDHWYGRHGAPELFGEGVYGLPELYREAIVGADLVANPGCYPTAALLGLAPLARAGVIEDVVIDAKSGVSGAGREPSRTHPLHRRRREPDALQGRGPPPHAGDRAGAGRAGRGAAGHLHAAPRAAGAGRARLLLRHAVARPLSDAELADLYREAYEDEPWVELALGPPGVLEVRDTNYCRISVHVDGRTGRVLVFSAIDNLWKGAASQAVQNLNLMFERDESEGLT